MYAQSEFPGFPHEHGTCARNRAPPGAIADAENGTAAILDCVPLTPMPVDGAANDVVLAFWSESWFSVWQWRW